MTLMKLLGVSGGAAVLCLTVPYVVAGEAEIPTDWRSEQSWRSSKSKVGAKPACAGPCRLTDTRTRTIADVRKSDCLNPDFPNLREESVQERYECTGQSMYYWMCYARYVGGCEAPMARPSCPDSSCRRIRSGME